MFTDYFFFIYQGNGGNLAKKFIIIYQKFIVPSPFERNKLREGGRDRQLSVVPIRILPYSNLRSVPTRYKYNGD